MTDSTRFVVRTPLVYGVVGWWCLLAVDCGRPAGVVSAGTVTLDGKPVALGSIAFHQFVELISTIDAAVFFCILMVVWLFVDSAEASAATATIRSVAPSRHLISVEAFHRMGETGILGPEDRVELIEGEIIDMSPIGVLHAAIVARLASPFSLRLGATAVVWCQNPLRLDDVSEPEPDISILRPRADFYTASLPGPSDVLLVIEVADTSLAYDLGTKVPLYARHGIPKVWVIDAATRQIRVFRGPFGGGDASRSGGNGYSEEGGVEPHEAAASAHVVDDAGNRVAVELARLLPPAG